MMMRNMRFGILKSLLFSVVIIIILIDVFIVNIPYISIKKYIEIYPFMFTFLLISLAFISNYLIYYFAMKSITEKSIIKLVKNDGL